MAVRDRKVVPVNIISGPLGIGKTTAINHLLSLRPEHEMWAVLVNEYGLVGLDAALLDDATRSGGVAIKEVAGGCICCTAGLIFEISLVFLLRQKPDRLLIEPTGLANVSGILDVLGRKGIRESVAVRSVISLLNPASYLSEIERVEVRDQVESADVLLANRADLATEPQLNAFEKWARNLFPPRRFVGRVVRGQIPFALLDLVQDHGTSAVGDHEHGAYHQHDHDHSRDHNPPEPPDAVRLASAQTWVCDATRPIVAHHHHSDLAASLGWVCWDGLVFDAKTTHLWLSELSRSPAIRRAKAVLRTNEGWWAFNLADDVEEMWPTGHRRNSRIEFVIQGQSSLLPEAVERDLRACVINEADDVTPHC